jgi:transposase InsO family protein
MSKGHCYIMTATDSFTKCVVASPLRNKSAVRAARVLVHDIILKFGCPNSIVTDQGGEFINELWAEVCRLLNISMCRTSPFQPSTNGCVERWHRSLNAMMGKVVDPKQKQWSFYLDFVVAAYNAP